MAIKIDRNELFKMAGFLGAGLLLVGLVRYSVQELMSTFNMILLIAGAVLSIASLVFNFNVIRAYSGRRSTRLGANTTVMTAAVVAILGFVNFLGYRHHKRIDLTTEKLYTLSDQTRKIVGGLNKDVRIILFDKKDDQGLGERMTEYRDLSRYISFEQIDPVVKRDVAIQHGVTRAGEILVICDSRTERPTDSSEQALTNAILKATREKLKTVCFVEGHGEKKLSKDEPDGYGVVDELLKKENYQTKGVNLLSSSQVPSDCDVLVVAGPKQPLFPQEASMIGKYLEQGGKAMVLIDPDTDPRLADVLKTWGIELGSDTVVDASGVGQIVGMGAGAPIALPADSHAITKDMGNTMTFFPLTRSVSKESGSSGGASVSELLKTLEQSWAETELKPGETPQLDEGKDKEGPITIGVAGSKTVGDNEARLVVIGDSDFPANAYTQVSRSNIDLFLNSINWLAQDEDLISIRPKSATDRRVTMTASQQNLLFWVTILLMPGAVIGSGLYIWWKRR